jgi:hypothetical protein
MTTKVKETNAEVPKEKKLQKAVAGSFMPISSFKSGDWTPEDVDKLEIDKLDNFKQIVKDCRFFYKRDPLASTVLNKTVEIGITEIDFEQGGLSDNEFRIYLGLKDKLHQFMECCALEYLLSGLVVPEIKYAATSKDQLFKMGIKKYSTLELPVSMWLRDPTTIKINDTFVGDKPSYFVVLPDELVFFIQNKGIYPDQTKDLQKYEELVKYYPEFVALVQAGNREVPLYNDLIIRRKYLTGTKYPVPYLYSVLESLKHKRNLRRMDYSLASRVITAIQLFNLGDKDFPVTEDDSDAFNDIKDQMTWRNSSGRDLERIYQLFANHTLKISWVMPDVQALLDDAKYGSINTDIFFGLGFPRILTTGETERTQTSMAEFAMISPVKSMENMQAKLLTILKDVVYQISDRNKLKDVPEVKFKKVNLYAIADFLQIMTTLYTGGNISRETMDEAFGFDFTAEMDIKEQEQKMLEEKKLGEFAPMPFSNEPTAPGQQPPGTKGQPNQPKPENKPKPKTSPNAAG